MKRSLVPLLRCPQCSQPVSLVDSRDELAASEVESGQLLCAGCRAVYPIVHHIPRFVQSDNYASSFGFQWNRFQRAQLDSHTKTTISRDRFRKSTGWNPESLTGASVLDVGCGAGRFAEVALSMDAQVFAVDYSDAVDACWGNLHAHPNLHVVQADIYALPFQSGSFDYVYCLGVLQHTPDPHTAFLRLPPQLKAGGRLAVDVYPKPWYHLFYPKYWLRPITTQMPRPALFRTVERAVPVLLPISRAVGRLPAVGPLLKRLIPVVNYEGVYPLTEEQLHEWAVLDTFDGLSPAYDRSQTPDTLRSWLEEAGLKEIELLKAGHLVGRGKK